MLRASLATLASVLLLAGCGGRLDIPSDTAGDGGVGDTGTDTGVLCDDPSACGPAIRMPAITCWDGSIGGNTGRCLKQTDGSCGWEIRECPPEKTCTGKPGECGASNLYCARPVGACGGMGKCAAKPDGCPTIYAPVCGCDGATYGNTCAADTAGVTVARSGECSTTTKACNPSAGMGCAPGEFCEWPFGACYDGASSGGSGGSPGAPPEPTPPLPTGTCTRIPEGCPDSWDPVCGCNGTTYSNRCDAQAAKVSVLHKGACESPPPPGKTCGGFAGFTCASSEWCDYADGDLCGGADGMGICRPRPTSCDEDYSPVCACNGVTYSNACKANRAGQDVLYKGTCH